MVTFFVQKKYFNGIQVFRIYTNKYKINVNSILKCTKCEILNYFEIY